MKPKYIFIAVFAICLCMAATLPMLAPSPETSAAAAPIAQHTPIPETASGGAAASVGQAVSGIGAEFAAQREINQTQAAGPAAADLAAVEPTAPPPAAGEQSPADGAQAADSAAAAAPPPATPVPDDIAAPVFQAPEGLPSPTPIPSAGALPALDEFAASLPSAGPETVVGVYVHEMFALPVVDQPAGQENYVSGDDGVVTRYGTPGLFGSVGLLAHNYLSGKAFYSMKENQDVVLIYGDGRRANFRVADIQYYQALSPHDPYSNFVDLADQSRSIMSYAQLFNRVYTTRGQVVFQTCFEANGDPSWGRIFIIANPV